jgi:hypothetical protein
MTALLVGILATLCGALMLMRPQYFQEAMVALYRPFMVSWHRSRAYRLAVQLGGVVFLGIGCVFIAAWVARHVSR